jgi:hypothetical protein
MALIKCYHNWLSWLDKDIDFVQSFFIWILVRLLTRPCPMTDIVCNKLKSLDINPYVTNWTISFLSNRKQRVVVDGVSTEFVSINRGVPQDCSWPCIVFHLFSLYELLPQKGQDSYVTMAMIMF